MNTATNTDCTDEAPKKGDLIPTKCPHCDENTDAEVLSFDDETGKVELICTECKGLFSET